MGPEGTEITSLLKQMSPERKQGVLEQTLRSAHELLVQTAEFEGLGDSAHLSFTFQDRTDQLVVVYMETSPEKTSLKIYPWGENERGRIEKAGKVKTSFLKVEMDTEGEVAIESGDLLLKKHDDGIIRFTTTRSDPVTTERLPTRDAKLFEEVGGEIEGKSWELEEKRKRQKEDLDFIKDLGSGNLRERVARVGQSDALSPEEKGKALKLLRELVSLTKEESDLAEAALSFAKTLVGGGALAGGAIGLSAGGPLGVILGLSAGGLMGMLFGAAHITDTERMTRRIKGKKQEIEKELKTYE